MSFGEITTIIGDVVEQKSHGGGVSMSSHPHGEWQGKLQIGERAHCYRQSEQSWRLCRSSESNVGHESH